MLITARLEVNAHSRHHRIHEAVKQWTLDKPCQQNQAQSKSYRPRKIKEWLGLCTKNNFEKPLFQCTDMTLKPNNHMEKHWAHIPDWHSHCWRLTLKIILYIFCHLENQDLFFWLHELIGFSSLKVSLAKLGSLKAQCSTVFSWIYIQCWPCRDPRVL